MANSKPPSRPISQSKQTSAGTAPASSTPRRLGDQPSRNSSRKPPRSANRSKSTRFSPGWIAVVLVVVVVGVLVGVKELGNSSPAKQSGSQGIVTGDQPALAPAAVVNALATVPSSVYNTVGVAQQPAGFVVTQKQPTLTQGGKPLFVYEGAEYCPYCALMRWSLIMALSRFGTFTNLKVTTSSSTDQNPNTPTFSFLGATYKSPYIAFTSYETENRVGQPLQRITPEALHIYVKYDGNASTGAPAPVFNTNRSAGIPFLDIANRFVSSGVPPSFTPAEVRLSDGGPGYTAIANGIRSPNSSNGRSFEASAFVAEANYISAGICAVDGSKPANVCNSTGVTDASGILSVAKPVG